MYRFSYAEILDESATLNRERERLALDQAVNLLTLAAKAEPGSREVLAAVAYLQKLWGFFISDLADANNELPRELRGTLASLGLWVIQECDRLISGTGGDIPMLIDVNRAIRDGLQ
ncbi:MULTISPECIES: flagellar biosynthesis regulator FlaF [Xanthobacter]|uniref:flagellar biosynthesis regulator FlaF n=1 Tax=Xanthobacter TaxID=279 RepID=UPI0035B3BE48